MAAPSQKGKHLPAGALATAAQALFTRVPEAQTSTHLESATAVHRGAGASFARSVGGSLDLNHKGKHLPAAVVVMAAQALSTRVPEAETSTHLESATAVHHLAGASFARSV